MSVTTPDVAVIGCGVIGLTTAILVRKHGIGVTVYADTAPLETVSAKAAASFKPHEVAYNAMAHELLQSSKLHYEQLMRDAGEHETGIRWHTHWEASSVERLRPPYLDLMDNVREHEHPEIPGNYRYAWSYSTFFVDTTVFLPWLMREFERYDGNLVKRALFSDASQLLQLSEPIIVNCTGFGSRRLFGDSLLRAVKGQAAIVDPQPSMDWSISADGFYIYPRRFDTVLGGTVEYDQESENVDSGTIYLIVRGNQRVLPHLRADMVRRAYAGIRPYRETSIRLEKEDLGGKMVIHNYGHGGAGVTLAWGSAEAVLRMI